MTRSFFATVLRSWVHPMLGAWVLGMLIGPALAQSTADWPVKPVRVISPMGAGTAVDFVCRTIGERLARAFGQQFVVENLVGASGIVGAQAASRAPNDGYTVFFAPASTLTSNIYQFKSLPYDPVRDLTAVAIVVDSGPFILSVHPDVPAQNLAEFIAYAKSQAGKLSYAVDVSSGYGVILGQWFNKTAGTRMEEITYKSAAQALQDTAAGRTQAIIASVPTTRPFATAGRLRSLAISSSHRFTTLDTLPTMSETIPGFQLAGWFALMVPTGTPAPIIERLNREVDRILQDSELVQRMLNVGLGASGAGTPQSANEFIRAERERWARIAKDIGIQPQ
jgi:tripartite-type tricarboxylate transporter receptor subunit TctC